MPLSIAVHASVTDRCLTRPERCGLRSSNWIVGGQEASPGRWAWQVSLQEYNVTSGRWVHVCGGALVHESWVVTAGHCIHALSNAFSVTAVLGSYNLSSADPGERRVKVDRLIGHPDYRHGGNYPNDVGLVHLANPVTMTRSISPVCLPGQEASADHRSRTLHGPSTRCWVTGWGRTLGESTGWGRTLGEYTRPGHTRWVSPHDLDLHWFAAPPGATDARVLNEAEVDLIDRATCAATWADFITSSHICAAGSSGGGACENVF
ncbi:hypothetical protein EGW08_002638 [Elysia chlorotica]|uniref:Peptidase S1 domain-containing protein n=1 Tax=Elysia chlorotica TaxID=188477 RepID=A0A3S0ZY82_ELYCH|nr:hypothetical protein EGW08_002638 [Elysia chlorotica]